MQEPNCDGLVVRQDNTGAVAVSNGKANYPYALINPEPHYLSYSDNSLKFFISSPYEVRAVDATTSDHYVGVTSFLTHMVPSNDATTGQTSN